MKTQYKGMKVIILVLLFAGPICLFLYTLQQQERQAERLEQLQQVPLFTFRDMEGKPFGIDSLMEDHKLWIAQLGTSCSSCWEQLSVFCQLSTEVSISNIELLLVIEGRKAEAQRIIAEMKALDCLPNARILLASTGEFERYFVSNALPTIYCYNEKGKLQARFKGTVKASLLKPYLKQSTASRPPQKNKTMD